MGLGEAAVYGMRRGARKLRDFHRFAGFDYFDFPDSELGTGEYRKAFGDVYGAYRGGLYAAALSDAADIFLKGKSTHRLSTFIDYALLNALNIKDFAYCRASEFNEYNWTKSLERFGQGMITGAIKNPESAPENIKASVDSIRGALPLVGTLFRKYWPWKTAFALGITFERADERHDNTKAGETSPTGTAGERGLGTFLRGVRDFIGEARENGGAEKMDHRNSEALKRIFTTAEGFVKRHPYVTGAAIAYAGMYVAGWYKNPLVDHFIRKESA